MGNSKAESKTGLLKSLFNKPNDKSGRVSLRPVKKLNKGIALAAFIAIFSLSFYLVFRVGAATPQGIQSNWIWNPPADGFTNLESSISIEQVTNGSPYFWANQFNFKGGDGGYIGLQSGGSRVNGTYGKTAVFSIFSAGIYGTPSNCKVEQAGFDGYAGGGTSCRIPFEWQTGRKYSMRVLKTASDSQSTTWTGSIVDTTSNTDTFIANIKVPKSWQGMGDWTSAWTEYFGTKPSSCDKIPYSKITFFRPTRTIQTTAALGSKDVKTEPAVHINFYNYYYQPVDCTNSKITNFNGGTVQEVGNPTPSAGTPSDNIPPSVTIQKPTNGVQAKSPISISASSSDNVAVTKMEIQIDGKTIKSSVSGGTGFSKQNTISTNYVASNASRAIRHEIKVNAYDAKGNIGSSSIFAFY